MHLEDTRTTKDSARSLVQKFAAFGGPSETLSALDLAQVCIRSTDGVIQFWSRGNERLYGWSREEALGEITHRLLETRLPKALSEIESELLRTGQWEGELQHRTKRGKTIWVASNWFLQRGRKDFPPYVVEVNNDITGLRRADEALRHLGTIVESSDDAIISKDLNGLVTSWNSGAERILGYTASEMIGEPITLLFPPQLVCEETEILARLRAGERIDHYETLRLSKSGRQVPVSITISPIHNAEGTLIGASKIARDISQKKEWETALIAKENRRRLAAEAGSLGLWSYDVSTSLMNWDGICKQMVGLQADAPPPTYPELLRFVHPDDRNRVNLKFQATLDEGIPFDVDFRIGDQNGLVRWVQTKGRPSFDAGWDIIGIHGTLLEFTARKQREEALLRANHELEQFAYSAAHDLQEPLRNAALSIGLAKEELNGHLSAQSERFLDYAVESAKRMHSMVKDLLAYSKAVADGNDHPPVILANDVVAEVINNLSVAIGAASGQVRCSELPRVRMQRIHLLQILQNLISNSLNFHGADPPVILIAAALRAGFAEFSVKDNGIGIDPQYQQRVFGAFRRLRDKEVPGTGMGLAICKRIVEHYGGKIWIESASDQGATLFFTVPAADIRQN